MTKTLTPSQHREIRESNFREQVRRAKAEEDAIERGINDTVARRLRMGHDLETRPKAPVIVKSPLQRLHEKETISERQRDAGTRYGRDYITANAAHLNSCLASLERVDGLTGASSGSAKERAMWNWEHAKLEGLKGQIRLINICNAICGREETLWDHAKKDPQQLGRDTEALVISLALLVAHYGI